MTRMAPRAALATLAACCCAASAAAQPAAVPDFSGLWTRGPAAQSAFKPPLEGPGPIINTTPPPPDAGGGTGTSWRGDYTNPILQPWAADIVRQHVEADIAEMPFLSAQQICSPHSVPYVLQLNDAVQFLQTPEIFAILYAREMRARLAYMNAEHPADLTPSYYGHSVAHWQGDTLVVDTIGLNDKTWTDRFGTPHTDRLHAVERYRLTDGGTILRAEFTVEDPGAFTVPWSAYVTYRREEDGYFEQVCAENNRDPFSGEDYPIPKDDTPDF